MADQKISELTAITGANTADDDVLVIVDTSASQTKKITLGELENALAERDFSFGDNDKLTFGASSDLQIYHDGSNSYVKDAGAGQLILQGAAQVKIQSAATGDDMIKANSGSDVLLYHNNAERLATSSAGIDVTGTVTADGLTVDGNATLQGTGDVTLTLASDTDNSGEDDSPTIIMTQDGGSHYGHVGVNGQANTKFTGAVSNTPYIYSGVGFQVATNAKVSARPSITVGSTGDISFYDSAGSSQSFFWDASAESLGIGTSSPSDPLHISSSTNLVKFQSTTNGLYNTYTSTAGTFGYVGSGSQTVSGAQTTDFGVQAALGNFVVATGGNTERMRIDSSGNLLVNQTDIGDYINTVGSSFRANGFSSHTRDGNEALLLNRLTSDGDIAVFRKDNSTVGSIGAGTGDLIVGNGDVGIRFNDSITTLVPRTTSDGAADGTISLGFNTARFKDLYLSGGVYLGGTGSANKLDDYETGEFDVTATPLSSGTVTLQSANNRASYTKVGRLVHCSGFFIVDSVSSPVGSELRMTLPFAAGQGGDQSLRVGMPIVHYDGSSDTVKPAIVIETESILKIIMDCSTIASGDAFYYGFTYQSA